MKITWFMACLTMVLYVTDIFQEFTVYDGIMPAFNLSSAHLDRRRYIRGNEMLRVLGNDSAL